MRPPPCSLDAAAVVFTGGDQLPDHGASHQAKAILSETKGKGFMADYDYTITPWVGCSFGCLYCYVPTQLYFLHLAATWGTTPVPKRNGPELLRRDARAGRLAGKRIYLSPNTDPYVPQERVARITRGLLEVMVEYPPALLVIQTRAPWVLDDLDLLRRLGRRVVVALSVTTDREDVRRVFEPKCPPIRHRVAALAALHHAGIRTQASLSPLLPSNVDALADLVEPHCDWIVVQALKQGRHGARTPRHAQELVASGGWQGWLPGGDEVRRAMARLRDRFGDRYHEGQAGFGLRWCDRPGSEPGT
jgi:DNA repair photolyase